jgi:hypothetical protein
MGGGHDLNLMDAGSARAIEQLVKLIALASVYDLLQSDDIRGKPAQFAID